MGITVKELINAPFCNRPPDDKIKIVSEGKPQPLLHMSAVTIGENGEMKTEIFDPVTYDKVSWLTACETTRCFYCWPCLLFSTENEHWNVNDLAFLSDAMAEHDKIIEHILSAIRLKKFSSELLKMEKINVDYDQCNQMSHTHTRIITLLVDAVCSIVAENKSLPRKTSRQNQIEPDICLKALNLLKLCNSNLFNFEDAIELIKMTPTVLDDVVDAMSKVVELAIRKEARMSTYAAVIISDHSTNREKSQMSVILRYIKKGKVCERFLGFINIFGFKSVDVLQEIIANTIATFGVTKFLAYSFDGAVLDLPALFELNSVLQKKYPMSFFVPCYFQGFVHVIQQSLSMHVELTQFFKILDVMEAYFQEASEQRKLFEHFMFLNISRESSKWYVNAPFIKIVCRCRNYFIKALESIIKNSSKWSAGDNTKAHGLIRFLEEFHTVCLLHILSPLFEHIKALDDVLRTSSPELRFGTDLVFAIKRDFRSERAHFEEYFNMAIQEMDKANNVEQENTLHIDYNDLKDPFQLLFITVIKHMEKEILLRFSRLDDLSFCSLVNVISFKMPQIQLDYLYWKLNSTAGHNFSSQVFDSEIIVQRVNGIDGMTAYDLLNLFEHLNLKSVFKCTNRLLEFTLTMPFRAPVLYGVPSKLQKIKMLSYPTTVCLETRGDATALYVESDFLRDLRSDEFFCDEVIQKLDEINRSKQI